MNRVLELQVVLYTTSPGSTTKKTGPIQLTRPAAGLCKTGDARLGVAIGFRDPGEHRLCSARFRRAASAHKGLRDDSETA
jgi:hypothetical protein